MTRLELLRARLRAERETMMTEATTKAVVPTTHGSRYLQQLCKHWGHRFEVEFDPQQGTIRFPGGAVATLEAGEGALTARIEASDAETLDRMKTVLSEHLDRFAFREAPLLFRWE